MAKRLFVGRLPYEVTSSQLEELFSQAGKVEMVNVITDRFSGQGKGFAFVEMASDEEAQKAIQTLNGYNLNGRSIVVNEAHPQEERSKGGGGYDAGRSGFSRNKRW
ncbi:MAG: RNA-binding protein [bacterium]|nr:RNA-binding protein [bacterium]